MAKQHYGNHARYVPGFHFLTLGLILAAFVVNIILMVREGITLNQVFMLLVTVSLGLLFNYTRQFATGNQDRIIREEENARSIRITSKPLDERLTRSQIIALRFASDDEYAELSQKALSQNLSSSDIKKSISQWRADHHRI